MLLLHLACTGAEPTAPPPSAEPPAEPTPADPPVALPDNKPDLTPPPPVTSVEGIQRRANVMKSQCERDCTRSLAFAVNPDKPTESRAVMWWGISAAEVPADSRARIETAAADLAAAPSALWSPMAASLRHTEAGRAKLTTLMTTGEDPALRAAAACALLGDQPAASWGTHDLGAEVISAMGTCTTPWRSAPSGEDAPG